jgi:hypothetical protein
MGEFIALQKTILKVMRVWHNAARPPNERQVFSAAFLSSGPPVSPREASTDRAC